MMPNGDHRDGFSISPSHSITDIIIYNIKYVPGKYDLNKTIGVNLLFFVFRHVEYCELTEIPCLAKLIAHLNRMRF